MSDSLPYEDLGLIKKDLKKLKKWSSLEKDIKSVVQIMIGYLDDNMLSPSNCIERTIFGDLITTNLINDNRVFIFKKRIPITKPKISPRAGARLVYAFVKTSKKFIPLLVFPSKNEGKTYLINGRNLPLTKTGIIQIVSEKINSLK